MDCMALKSRRGTSGTMGGFTEANGPTTGQSDQSDARATMFACPGYSIWAEDTGRMSGTGTFTWRDGRKCSPAGFVGSYTKTGNGFVKLWFWQQELVLIRYVGSYQHDKKAMAIAC